MLAYFIFALLALANRSSAETTMPQSELNGLNVIKPIQIIEDFELQLQLQKHTISNIEHLIEMAKNNHNYGQNYTKASVDLLFKEKSQQLLNKIKGTCDCTAISGIPGTKGDRGDIGYPGMIGLPGRPGIMGDRGAKGERGRDGSPGLPGEHCVEEQ